MLKKEVEDDMSHYREKNKYGNIHIIVKGIKQEEGSAEVIYNLPSNIQFEYQVDYKDTTMINTKMVHIKDDKGNLNMFLTIFLMIVILCM